MILARPLLAILHGAASETKSDEHLSCIQVPRWLAHEHHVMARRAAVRRRVGELSNAAVDKDLMWI